MAQCAPSQLGYPHAGPQWAISHAVKLIAKKLAEVEPERLKIKLKEQNGSGSRQAFQGLDLPCTKTH